MMTRGITSAYFDGIRSVHTLGGSMMWSSTDVIQFRSYVPSVLMRPPGCQRRCGVRTSVPVVHVTAHRAGRGRAGDGQGSVGTPLRPPGQGGVLVHHRGLQVDRGGVSEVEHEREVVPGPQRAG